MNIDSPQDWIKLIISSAGVSAAINIAWGEWGRYRDKKYSRRNAYLELSNNIEDYAQSCIDNIDLESRILEYSAYNQFIGENNGKHIYLFDKPRGIEKPDFRKSVLEKINADFVSVEDRSDTKETANYIEQIGKAHQNKVETKKQELKIHDNDPSRVFEDIFLINVTSLVLRGRKACDLAIKTRKKSRTKSKSLDEKISTLNSMSEKYGLTL